MNDHELSFIKKLPSWFSLELYHGVNQLDLEGWINQICLRQVAQDFYLPFVYKGIVLDFHIPEVKKPSADHQAIKALSTHDAILVTEGLKNYLPAPAEVWQSRSFFDSLPEVKDKINLISWFNHNSDLKAEYRDKSICD